MEATVVITAMAVVAGTAGSHMSEYLNVARTIKVRGDESVIVSSVLYFLNDVGRLQGANGGPPPSLLVSDGDAPEPGRDEAQPWALPVDGRLVQDLYAHMVENTVGYRRWRGPYLSGLGSDPWGSRYGINVGCLTAAGTGYVTIVMSPGPDGRVDAAFRSRVLLARQSDDQIGLVSTGKDGGAAPAGGPTDSPDLTGLVSKGKDGDAAPADGPTDSPRDAPTTPVSSNLCMGADRPRNP